MPVWIRSLPEISRLLIQSRTHAELRGSCPQALITCPEAGVGRQTRCCQQMCIDVADAQAEQSVAVNEGMNLVIVRDQS
ncbi:hypothetical protein EP837_02103 [Sphingobium sp. EP60837]|nr:hypothetical protein EP837_02103 [Sphingobium sp. EP60837]